MYIHYETWKPPNLLFPSYASCGLAEGFPIWELAGHSYGFMTAIIRGTGFRRRIAVSVGADTEKRNGRALSKPVMRYFILFLLPAWISPGACSLPR